MRIIAGIYGGRRLDVPKNNDIRPTSDKVRGSIFNALLSRVDLEGAHVIDAFCGTGALGIEALSRGAGSCLFIDSAKDSLELARRNVAALDDFLEADFIQADAAALRPRGKAGRPADLFFCDPPYRQDLIAPCLQKLMQGGWLAAGAIGVVEAEKGWSVTMPQAYRVLSEKTYGDTAVVYISYDP